MRKLVARRMLSYFRQRYDYDTTYMDEMLERTPRAFFKFAWFMRLAQHRDVTPPDAYFTAKLVGALSEDCGPCTQLVTDMALEAGVPSRQLQAVIEGDRGSMESSVAIAYEFAKHLCEATPELETARERVRQTWSEAAVIELSLAVAASRVFPITKRGMGRASECVRVRVGEAPVEVARAAP